MDSKEEPIWHLYLHNDNHNNFWTVIRALCEIVKHSQGQAEQCALIAHNNGKAHIKQGHPDELYPMQQALEEVGLDVELRQKRYESF